MGRGGREATWHKVNQGQDSSRRWWWLLCTRKALDSGSGDLNVLTVKKVNKGAS